MKVSAIGFGASPLGDVYGAIDRVESERAVHAAIDNGINFFDVSPYYGRTLAESRLGEALDGVRQKVFVATKCGRYDTNLFDFSKRGVTASVDESLKRLRTDYIDLLQAHDIEFGNRNQIIEETLPALRELQKQGKTRFVGITSYQLRLMARTTEEEPVDTVLSYCRYNLLIDDMNRLLLPSVQAKQIGLINASPLHMGLLAGTGIPDWHPSTPRLRQAASAFKTLCFARGVDPTQIALRFCLDHPYVATTLVGMFSVEQVLSNVRALEVDIDPQLLEGIHHLFQPVKNVVWPSGMPENADYQLEAARV